jgi:hypothetical protein
MSESLTATGRLHKKGETEQVTDSFRKRELVLEIEDGKYTQTVPFELLQDRCPELDKFEEGQTVTVHFNLRGREWNGRFFVNLAAWRIEAEQDGSDVPY